MEKLREVIDHMTAIPEKCDMDVVILEGLTPHTKYTNCQRSTAEDHTVPRCGTVGCIAGWTSELNGFKPVRGTSVDPARMDFAREILDLTEEEAQRLFIEPRLAGIYGHSNAWPLDLAKEYREAATVREKAAVIRRRAERFITTNGAE